MANEILSKIDRRNIIYRDDIGLLHQCRGCRLRRRAPLFWTLCHLDAPADRVRPQRKSEVVSCPDCREIVSRPARQILEAFALRERPAVGGPPFRSQDAE
jgi:hypothetical protein